MRIGFFPLCLALHCLLLGPGTPACAAPWNTPVTIDDTRVSLQFSIVTDSGTVKGRARDVSGKVWLANVSDPGTVRSHLTVPVDSLEVGGDSRLQQAKMLLLMAGVQTVELRVERMGGGCSPERLPCSGSLEGSVELQGTEHPMRFPVSIAKQGVRYVISGRMSVNPGQIAPELLRRLTQAFVREFSLSYRILL